MLVLATFDLDEYVYDALHAGATAGGAHGPRDRHAATGVMVVLALPVFGMRLSKGDPRMLPESAASQRWK
jgi:hypothetical protein